jgi:hypothetical protein
MSAQHPFLNSIDSINASYLDRLYDSALSALTSAIAAVNAQSTSLPPAPDFTGLNPAMINPGDVILGDLPAIPNAPNLIDVPIGDMPIAPILTTDQIATDALLKSSIARIISEIEYRLANPTGLKQSVENALFMRGVDRENKLMSAAYGTYLAVTSAMGFESSEIHDKAAFLHFETEKQGKLSDINRDIMVKQADLEQNNLQKTLDLFQSLQAQLFGQKQSDEANKIRLFEVKIDSVIKTANLYIDINKGFIDIYASEVNAFAAVARVRQDDAKFRMEQYNQINQMNIQLTNISLEKIKVMEQHYASNAQIAVERIKTIGAINGQAGASMFNAINISESFSTGKSWHYGESLSA